MRLRRFEIRNYKCIEHVALVSDDTISENCDKLLKNCCHR